MKQAKIRFAPLRNQKALTLLSGLFKVSRFIVKFGFRSLGFFRSSIVLGKTKLLFFALGFNAIWGGVGT